MKVKMLRRTYTSEIGFLKAGEIYETDEKTANRWVAKRLAMSVEVEKPVKARRTKMTNVEDLEVVEPEDFGTFEEAEPEKETSEYKYSELIDIAKNLGIDVHSRPKKADLIVMIDEVSND
jgi:hypothetical protein